MFDVTADDIAQLDDKQLRELIGLLCEVELRRRSYSTAAVTWGGDQNAKDGGVDVRVALPEGTVIDGYIPKYVTGFQVKCQDMPPRMIRDEMWSDGVLRDSLHELAEAYGAYIIVSSKGSVADSALTARRTAMSEASKDYKDKLYVEFYDRTRIASWVRNHLGMILRVRQTVGRGVPGWEPFGAWAYSAGGVEEEYLMEQGVRIKPRPSQSDVSYSAEEGLNRIRNVLFQPKNIVRLVGLSGVGKTRFVQALFDARIGADALDPSYAVYTNGGNEPNPPPYAMATELIAQGRRVVLVIDNCASDLHSRLIQLVKSPESQLSVITIEYDIRDDVAEHTDVFEMQVASVELVEKLVRTRYSDLSPIDARTAAECSGGNARIAIALAGTVSQSGTLARLSDAQLFERLFVQRHETDRSLLRFAQACSLVYSFNGEDISAGADSELPLIAEIAGTSIPDAMYNVAVLMRRELAQKRGKWRAILPHALANHLASDALQNFQGGRLNELVSGTAPVRLLTSFSRRLGYLDKSLEAKKIVETWLDPKGYIGAHIWSLNAMGRTLLRNCLPANQGAGLRAIEANVPDHGSDNPISNGDYLIKLIRSIAWDKDLFDRCVALLRLLSVHGDEDISKKATEACLSLFPLYLSGTHASAQQRLKAVCSFIVSDEAVIQDLGVKCLSAMLKTDHFSSDYEFQFGAHSRDFGYQPTTWADQTAWYEGVLQLAEETVARNKGLVDAVKSVVADRFRGLWRSVFLKDKLEALIKKISESGFWPEGWNAVRQTRAYDVKDKGSEDYRRLSKLEEMLRPSGLVEQVRGKVLGSKSWFYDNEDVVDHSDPKSFHDAMEAKNNEAIDLGEKVAGDSNAFQDLLPEIVGSKASLWFFGMGLARGSKDPTGLWQAMIHHLEQAAVGVRNISVFRGLLFELKNCDPFLVASYLDAAINSGPLGQYFPSLQAAVALDEAGLDRLLKSLDVGAAPIAAYGDVYLGAALDTTPPAALTRYLIALSSVPGGSNVAIQLISIQFHNDMNDKNGHRLEIIKAGKAVLQNKNFDGGNEETDYHICRVLEVCLPDADGYQLAKNICENFIKGYSGRSISAYDHGDFLKVLFKVQPRAALDAFADSQFVIDEAGSLPVGLWVLERASLFKNDLLDQIDETVLFNWCSAQPDTRYDLAARIAPVFELGGNENHPVRRPVTGWSPVAARLVHAAPDPVQVMGQLVKRLHPTVWSGARSVILKQGADMLAQFDVQGNARLAAYIASVVKGIEGNVKQEEDWERKYHREREESFED